jgi:hypothetical protein
MADRTVFDAVSAASADLMLVPSDLAYLYPSGEPERD